jgi:hypothetical protein
MYEKGGGGDDQRPPSPDPLGLGVECPSSRIISPSFGPTEEVASWFASAARGAHVPGMYSRSSNGWSEGGKTRELLIIRTRTYRAVDGGQRTGID